MIEEGVKVETDTTRNMGQSDFDRAFDDDETAETPGPAVSGSAEPSTPAPAVAAEEQTAEASAPETPLTREDGAIWSEKSQRWHKDGKIVAGEPPVVQAAASPTPVFEPPKPEPIAPPPVGEPYWVRHAGQKVTIPHATRNPDGSLNVKPEGEAQVRSLLSQALAHQQSWPQEKQRYEQRIQQAGAVATAKAEKYHNASLHLWSRLEGMLKDQPAELEYARRELALMLREADLTIPKEAETPEPDENAIRQAAMAVLTEEIDDLLDSPAGSVFQGDERTQTSQTLLALLPAFFVEYQGETVLDRHALKRAFDERVTMQNRIREAASKAELDAKKAREALAFNAKQNTPVPVPAIRPKPNRQPVAAGKGPTFEQAWDSDDD